MAILKRIINKARRIDPFFEEVKTEQISLYQHYLNKVIASIDVDTQTNWSMGKAYDKNKFKHNGEVMNSIIVEQAAAERLIPAVLQVIVHQYFFANVHQREMDRNFCVVRVMHWEEPDYFPSGWQVRSLLESVTA